MEIKPTDILAAEHRIIEKVVKAIGLLAEGMEAGRDVPPEFLKDVVGFMRGYGDYFHHGKEEKELFPFLEEKGIPAHGCPTEALIQEHDAGRNHLLGLSRSIDSYACRNASGKATVVNSLKGLAGLYPAHIWKEEYLLFPMINTLMTAGDQEELHERFIKADMSLGQDLLVRYRELASRMEMLMQPV